MTEIVGNVLTFDFTDEDWRTKFPDRYTVADGGTKPWYTASTFTYDGKNTLRSGAISHNQTSSITITVTLVEAGKIELNYAVTSEGNYDKLFVIVDGTAELTKSGSVSFTDWSKELTAGEHTVTFQYTKDGSNSTGADAGAIGKLIITGVMPPYDRKYLIRSGDTVYTVADDALSALEETELTAEVFRTYGVDDMPAGSLLVGLSDPEVIYWHDSTDDLPTLTVAVTGVPPTPQIIVTNDQDMSDSTILGIQSATVDASEDVLFALSFDGGQTWKAYDGSQWLTIDTDNAGMTKATFEQIGLEAWKEVVSSDLYRLRFALMSTESYVKSVVINYINEESEESEDA